MSRDLSEERCARIRAHYDKHQESRRLASPHGKLELERTKRIISRRLPAAPVEILDVGGGVGSYAFWLADLGHRVTYVDLSDAHVNTVRARDRERGGGLAAIHQGTALRLDLPPRSFDIVLNMGPMYHLIPAERSAALGQMRGVLRDDGLLVSTYISRFAALMDGYKKGYIRDPRYVPLALGDVVHGIHDSPDDDNYFTLAFMHYPEEVASELTEAGFSTLDLCAVEGLFWTYPNLGEYTDDPKCFARLLEHAELIEHEASVMGASAHLLAVAQKSVDQRDHRGQVAG